MEKYTTMILTANIGSASKKYSLFRDAQEMISAHFEKSGQDFIVSWKKDGAVSQEVITPDQYEMAAELVTTHAKQHGTLIGIGIRVVAPGKYFQEHRRIDDEYLTKLAKAQEFAPLHISATLAEIQEMKKLFPQTLLFAISDSNFHKTLPEVASCYALPREFVNQFELRRFGYHGLSLQSIVKKLRGTDGAIPEKVIVCHLGSGCSITALKNGQSIETSMGFSPLEGLVMATRSGSIDPSVILLLAEKSGLSLRDLEKKLNNESGLLAIGGSSDIRELLKLEKKGDAAAKLALELFSYRVRQYIGAYAATLGGVDALVFTGTAGERSAIMRARILAGLEFLKLKPAARANNKILGGTDGQISKPESKIPIYVFTTNEAEEIRQIAKGLSS